MTAPDFRGEDYGQLGPPHNDPEMPTCCWGERWVWYGNAWGYRHVPQPLQGCTCECHADQIFLGGANGDTEIKERTA